MNDKRAKPGKDDATAKVDKVLSQVRESMDGKNTGSD